jgi:hypothetical protein
MISFPGSAWEREAPRLCLVRTISEIGQCSSRFSREGVTLPRFESEPLRASRRRSLRSVRSQAEPGNE